MTLFELPPILYLAVAIAAYPLLLAVRDARGIVLLVIALVISASFIVLPEGRELLKRSDSLPDRPQRVECFARAVAHGAPVIPGAVARTDACIFTGRGFPGQGDRAKARQMISQARSALR